MVKIIRKEDTVIPTGQFNRRIAIQQLGGTRTASGGKQKTWTTVMDTWAHIENWKGATYWNAQQIDARTYIRVLLRYRKDFNIVPGKTRLLYNNHTYEIISTDVIAQAQTVIELLVREDNSKGTAPTQ